MPGPRSKIARVVVALALAMMALPSTAVAQAVGKTYRIGFLSLGSSQGAPDSLRAFRDGMRAHGWIEGQNYVIEIRYAEGRADRLPELAADLVRSNVDVIAAGGGTSSVAAKSAAGTTPVVMIAAGDPVNLGLVSSLARPGGTVTGLAWDVGLETFAKALEVLKETVPKVRRVAVLINPTNPGQALAIGHIKTASQTLRLELRFVEAREPKELDGAFDTIAKERHEAALVVADPVFLSQRSRVAELAVRHRLASIFGGREYVEAGGLMSYGPSLEDAFRRAATFVDRILKGAKPADLPVEQPTKFELVINLKTAKSLGLTIPQTLLLRADRVVE